MLWLIGTVFFLLFAVMATYFLAPAVAFNAAMALARLQGRLALRECEVDGHRVSYLEGGSGEPLLLVHGFGANKDHWTMIAPFLTRRFRVIALDVPGFGDSSRVDSARYDADTQLARLEAFAAAIGLERFHIGGNSMGGYLAALYAARHPQAVASVWLLAPAGALEAQPSEVFAMFDRGENPLITETMADFDRLGALCFHTVPPMPSQFKRPLLARAQRDAAFNRKIFEEMFSDPVGLEQALDNVDVPAFVVWGDDDRVLHCSGLDMVAARFRGAQTRLMKNMGHVPMLERPAECASDYLEFRASLSAPEQAAAA